MFPIGFSHSQIKIRFLKLTWKILSHLNIKSTLYNYPTIKLILIDNYSCFRFDLKKLKRESHSLKVSMAGIIYIFDFCKAYETKCDPNGKLV